MGSEVSWVIEASISDAEAFKALWKQLEEATRAEDGVLIYEAHANEDFTQMNLLESYANSDALARVIGFGKNALKPFLACAKPTRMRIYGSPSEELTRALAGFKPVTLSFAGGFRAS